MVAIPKRRVEYEACLHIDIPPSLGVLEIPSLRLRVPILEGTDDLTLDRTVGPMGHCIPRRHRL